MLEVAARPIGGLCARALNFSAIRPSTSSGRPEPVEGRNPQSRQSRFEELLQRHTLGEGYRRVAPRDATQSGVMMIPIPRRGILRGVGGIDAARAVPDIDDIQNHREAGSTARAAARRRQLPRIHLRAGVERIGGGSRRCARRTRGWTFAIDPEVPGAHAGANTLQSAAWLIPADTRRRRQGPRSNKSGRTVDVREVPEGAAGPRPGSMAGRARSAHLRQRLEGRVEVDYYATHVTDRERRRLRAAGPRVQAAVQARLAARRTGSLYRRRAGPAADAGRAAGPGVTVAASVSCRRSTDRAYALGVRRAVGTGHRRHRRRPAWEVRRVLP